MSELLRVFPVLSFLHVSVFAQDPLRGLAIVLYIAFPVSNVCCTDLPWACWAGCSLASLFPLLRVLSLCRTFPSDFRGIESHFITDLRRIKS